MCIVAKLWSRKMKVKTKRKYKQMQNRLTETYFNETIEWDWDGVETLQSARIKNKILLENKQTALNSLISGQNVKLKAKQVKLLRTTGLKTEPKKQGSWCGKTWISKGKEPPNWKWKQTYSASKKHKRYFLQCVEIWLLKLLKKNVSKTWCKTKKQFMELLEN